MIFTENAGMAEHARFWPSNGDPEVDCFDRRSLLVVESEQVDVTTAADHWRRVAPTGRRRARFYLPVPLPIWLVLWLGRLLRERRPLRAEV
jgi:hypothetical protein